MKKTKKDMIKRKRHVAYVIRKRFYKKFGRKLNILLSKKNRNANKYKVLRKKKEGIKKLSIKKESVVIDLPEILSLEAEYRGDFLIAINKLRKYLSSKKHQCSIDHSRIIRIDPEALLVLAAEIKRSVSNIHTRYLKYNNEYAPKNEQVIDMLNSIGYWKHFNINTNSMNDSKGKYLKILHDTEANNKHVVELRDFFNDQLQFLPSNTTDMFDNAISEAIANSVEHAYIKKQDIVTINRAWWLAGAYNTDTKELVFGCYDQGIGVKEALGHHASKLMKLWIGALNLMTQSDSSVIETLVNEELPKYKHTDRGHGFKHFIKFIEDYPEGSLNIYSKKGEYKVLKQNDSIIPKRYDFSDVLYGTLIVWKIKYKEI